MGHSVSTFLKIEANSRATRVGHVTQATTQGVGQAYQSQEQQTFSTVGTTGNILSGPCEIQLQCTDLGWMNASFNFPSALETPGPPTWPVQPLSETGSIAATFFDVGSQDVGSQEQSMSSSNEPPDWRKLGLAPTASSVRPAAPQGESEITAPKPAATRPMSAARSREKKRLLCSHLGCNSTFPRKYELERHRTTVHDCNVRIFCSVYGCPRISKPFPRLDKFYEHVRKHHKGPERFLCILESCRQGPLTRTELVNHLNTQHTLKDSQQPHLKDSLNALGLPGQFWKGKAILLENGNACPLKSLGCEYSQPPSSSSKWKMQSHLEQHELLERSKGYEMIVAFGLWNYGTGVATCPVCKAKIGIYLGQSSMYNIISHVSRHSSKERNEHAVHLAQMFRPYLTGHEWLGGWERETILKWMMDPEFRARVEESGVLSAPISTSEDSELLLSNAHRTTMTLAPSPHRH